MRTAKQEYSPDADSRFRKLDGKTRRSNSPQQSGAECHPNGGGSCSAVDHNVQRIRTTELGQSAKVVNKADQACLRRWDLDERDELTKNQTRHSQKIAIRFFDCWVTTVVSAWKWQPSISNRRADNRSPLDESAEKLLQFQQREMKTVGPFRPF